MATPKQMLAADGVARVFHGEQADALRPTGFAVVIWQGSVEPQNAANGDIWIDTG